jgi:glycosyltransferase involved in cell wall biosynthesis
MRIVWITRSFLDYRVPVFAELVSCCNGNFRLLYSRDGVPSRVSMKVCAQLGERAEGLGGEIRFPRPNVANVDDGGFANERMSRIVIQPGLAGRILAFQPDVMVTDGFFKWTTCALRLRAIRKVPHVMCYERTAHTERNAQWYRTVYRKLVMRWIDAMCCNGRLCGEYVQSLGFPAERITYGHMVADVEGVQQAVSRVSEAQNAAVKLKLDVRGLVFLYVGRLIPLKGIDRLLEAWKVFSSQTEPDGVTLLLVGDGPQRGELEQYCVTHGLPNVRFAGAVDYDALAPFYKAADVFIIPTLEDNWSLVVPEAMASGLPILCSQYNGCWPEYVTSSNGWVFDPLDVDDTVECLRRCLVAKAKLPEMGRQSLQIIGHHTAQQAAEAVLKACRIATGK